MTRLTAFIIKYMVEYRSNEERGKGSGSDERGNDKRREDSGKVKKQYKNDLKKKKEELDM